MLSLNQVARTWWAETIHSETNASRRLRVLVGRGLVSRLRMNLRPELELHEPVARWQVGDKPPAFGEVAYRLQQRWVDALQPTTVYVATPRARREFGGPKRRFRSHQASHDLHVSSVYLLACLERPELAEHWVGEDAFAPLVRHTKVPDAVIRDGNGRTNLVIEFGAGYDKKRVTLFHQDCSERKLAYEIW